MLFLKSIALLTSSFMVHPIIDTEQDRKETPKALINKGLSGTGTTPLFISYHQDIY